MAKRKTYTSNEVKDRWKAKAYDRVPIYVRKGAKDEIKKVAELAGLSVSEYIRQAVKEKAEREDTSQFLQILRGGGGFDPAGALMYQDVLAMLKEQVQPHSTLY